MKHEVKVGQVWEDIYKDELEVLAFKDDLPIIYYRKAQKARAVRTVEYEETFFKLISDPDKPWLPLPEGCVLVTDEQREKCSKPDCAMIFGKGWFDVHNNGRWADDPNTKYCVPEDYEWPEEKPLYKLFPIDWNRAYPRVKSKNGCAYFVGNYPKVDGYRIGLMFTNHDDIEKCLNKNNCLDKYFIKPYFSDGTKCKYAIGRLEE